MLHDAKKAKEVLKQLKEEGANPNARNDEGDCPIHCYISRYNDKHSFHCMMTLLVHGRTCDLDKPNRNGDTALHLAATAFGSGTTPLHPNLMSMIKALLAFGATVNSLNKDDLTPLDIAHCANPESELVAILTALGGLNGVAATSYLFNLPQLVPVVDPESGAVGKGEFMAADGEASWCGPGGGKEGMQSGRRFTVGGVSRLKCCDGKPEADLAHMRSVSKGEGYAAWQKFRKNRKKRPKTIAEIDPMVSCVSATAPLVFQIKKGERILCLDGGSMRGLIQIEILSYIEDVTQCKITELFDWIVGTSTGGVVALALVYGDKSLLDLRQIYFEIKEIVFEKKKLGYVCDTPAFEEILKRYLTPDKKMGDVRHPKVLITAVDKSTTELKLRLFNNCFSDEFGDDNLVWKVGRYTSAAPPYFTECDNYIDGGILAHNPTEIALNRIGEHLSSSSGKIASLLSIGCGIFPPQPVGNLDIGTSSLLSFLSRVNNLVTVLTTALTRAENVVENCKARCEKEKILFYRFNPQLDEPMGSLESDSGKLCEVILKAKMLLQSNDTEMDLLIQHMYYITAHRQPN